MDLQSLATGLEKLPWVSLLTGGVAGAFLTHYFSMQRQRTELTFKVLEQFFKTYPELGAVKTILGAKNVQRRTPSYNQVAAVGDWYEIVSLFYRANWLDRKILKRSGIVEEVRRFRELAAGNEALTEALSSWREMQSIT